MLQGRPIAPMNAIPVELANPFDRRAWPRFGAIWSRTWYQAPGRVELIGNHVDYNGGPVLAAAIDRGIVSAGARFGSREESFAAYFPISSLARFTSSTCRSARLAIGAAATGAGRLLARGDHCAGQRNCFSFRNRACGPGRSPPWHRPEQFRRALRQSGPGPR